MCGLSRRVLPCRGADLEETFAVNHKAQFWGPKPPTAPEGNHDHIGYPSGLSPGRLTVPALCGPTWDLARLAQPADGGCDMTDGRLRSVLNSADSCRLILGGVDEDARAHRERSVLDRVRDLPGGWTPRATGT